MECPKCKRIWDDDSEQAACIFVYNQCIVCCVEAEKNGYIWSVEKVQKFRYERMKNKENR